MSKGEQNIIVSNETTSSKELKKNELNDDEKIRLDKYLKQSKNKALKFKNEKNKEGKDALNFVNPDDPLNPVKLTEALGTAESGLQYHLINQAAQTFYGVVSEETVNTDCAVSSINDAMAILKGIQPKDEIEGMLAVKMIGVHNMAMRTMGLAMVQGQSSKAKQANIEQATKMLRTFISQMEALKKYRTGGQIKMFVGNVSVNDGGQAIVGSVSKNT